MAPTYALKQGAIPAGHNGYLKRSVRVAGP